MTISELSLFLARKEELSQAELEALHNDKRRGTKELLTRFARQRAAQASETERLNRMLIEERILRQQGFKLIAGVDEAGRGPLAGPVVAAAVILAPGTVIRHLNDSKQLTAARRGRLFEEIVFEAEAYGLGSATCEEIDKLNIHAASLLAMERAIAKMALIPDFILIDGYPLKNCGCGQKALTGGDARSLSIAAASVLAKVTRDNMMLYLHEKYPLYGFNQHKGYGTREHRRAIAAYGPCPEHRQSFRLTGNLE